MATSKPTNSYDFFSSAQKSGQGAFGSSGKATAFTGASELGLGGYRTDTEFSTTGAEYGGGGVSPWQIQDRYNQQRLFTDVAFEKGREDLTRQLAAVQGGYGKAENALSRYGRSQKQTALDRETELTGELSARSGGQSYMYDYYRRSLSNDTTRSLQAVDDQLSQMFAGLYTQAGIAEGGILGNRAGTYLQQADAYQSLLAQEGAEKLGFAPGQSAPTDYSGFYNFLGSLAGAAGTVWGESIAAEDGK